MNEVTSTEARPGLSRLLDAALQGQTTTITRNGRPVARITPWREKPPLMALGAEVVVKAIPYLDAQQVIDLNLELLEPFAEAPRDVVVAIAREAASRGWPEGWYEDPSVVPELSDGDA